MRAPIKDEMLLAVLWERFPEIMSRKPQRTWVELNDEQYIKIADETFYAAGLGLVAFARALDAKLKELNHD